MQEIVRITLQNEMDLIIAHRRSMRLAELAGLSLSAQTTFATAVSEVSRSTIESGKNGCLILSVAVEPRNKYIIARVTDERTEGKSNDGLEYAKRLVNKYNVSYSGEKSSIELYYSFQSAEKTDINKLDEWRTIFRNEPSVSPYEEIKKKNDQLQELTQKLKESDEQYKTLTNSLPLIIFSLDANSQLIYANEWLSKFTGLTIAQLNETKWKTVVHPDDYDAVAAIMNKKIASGVSALKAECRLKYKNGHDWLWHLISVSPIKDEKNEVIYHIGFMADINSQKLVEETLKDNKELIAIQQQLNENQAALQANITELNRSNYELQQFAFIASHDLQEPIRKITYYSDALLEKYDGSQQGPEREYLERMASASQRMKNLIQDLLSFSQVDKRKLNFSPVSLSDILVDVMQNLEVAIKEKNAVIEIGEMPVIDADRSMMHQLFENLVSNALKYSKENIPPHITITSKHENDDIFITVADNGIGFDEQYLSKIFNLFQRLHTREKYKGTGLGLAICKKIVDLHNGHITASGKDGEGASFTVTLPAVALAMA